MCSPGGIEPVSSTEPSFDLACYTTWKRLISKIQMTVFEQIIDELSLLQPLLNI